MVSKFLKEHLHSILEDCTQAEIPTVVDQYRALGGYLKRYRGGPLNRFRDEQEKERSIGLDEMCVLAFLKVSFASQLDTLLQYPF